MRRSEGLIETLGEAQRLGLLGSRPIVDAVAHSEQIVDALGELDPATRVLDLGSGGGLPGLVLAEAYPTAEIVLLDRRQKRTDFLERAVRRLCLGNTVVWCRDAEHVAGEIEADEIEPFDVVTARGFGPPARTLRIAATCCASGGRIVITEPPESDRWPPDLLDEMAVAIEQRGRVVVFRRR